MAAFCTLSGGALAHAVPTPGSMSALVGASPAAPAFSLLLSHGPPQQGQHGGALTGQMGALKLSPGKATRHWAKVNMIINSATDMTQATAQMRATRFLGAKLCWSRLSNLRRCSEVPGTTTMAVKMNKACHTSVAHCIAKLQAGCSFVRLKKGDPNRPPLVMLQSMRTRVLITPSRTRPYMPKPTSAGHLFSHWSGNALCTALPRTTKVRMERAAIKKHHN